MTTTGFLLYAIGGYLFVGLLIGLAFVLKGIRRVDTAADAAPILVRLLFLPGSVAIWPIVVRVWIAKLHEGADS